MEYIKFLKSKKILILAAGVVIVAGISGFIFYEQRLPTYKLSIEPTKLLPFVSHKQARMNVCSTMKGQLFEEICQSKFDSVAKGDAEKIGALFSLIKKIENNSSISDYERSLLAQAIFASLPTKDSPLTQRPGFPALLVKLRNFIGGKNIAYAKESNDTLGIGEEGFKKMMLEDLKIVANGDLPEEDNAWIINIMISKYAWVNGVAQPIYSEQYSEYFDPYSDIIDPTTGEELEGKSAYEQYLGYHIKSIVNSHATSQAMYSGPVKEGSGEMLAYSYTMLSYHSKPYGADSVLTLAETGPGERYDSSITHYSDKNYKGDDMLSGLLNVVKMPSREGRTENPQKKVKSPEKMTQTAWGTADAWETAYENYFWMHLQSPDGYPTFWDIYKGEGAIREFMRTLPLGEPVDLRAYFNTPGVKDYYTEMKEAGANIPSLDEFLNNIDQYQTNLGLSKPAEQKQESPDDQVTPLEVNPQVKEFDRWLKECANRPLPKTRAELYAREKEDSNPSSPCYDPNL